MIEKEESPDIALIEITYSNNRNINDIISLIDEISGNYNLKIPIRILLGLMYKDFLDKKISINVMTNKLYSLSLYLTENNLDKNIIHEFNTMNDYNYIYTYNQTRQKLDVLLNQYLRDGVSQWFNY